MRKTISVVTSGNSRSYRSLIAGTKTRTGLTVRVKFDHDVYQKGIKVTDREMKELPLVKHKFHGDWNYTIKK